MPFKITLFDTDFDCIGTGCMSLDYIRYQLEQAGGQDLEIDISSGGGSAFDAVAIYHLLKAYPGKVTTNNIALAGSAASTIFAAGEERIMSKYALLMIHPAQVGSFGDANDLTADAAMLQKVTENIISIWVDVTGLPENEIADLVNATTWLTAEDALAKRFITKIEDYAEEAEPVRNAAVVLNQVSTAPIQYKQVINKILVKTPEAQPASAQTENTMTIEEQKELQQKNEGLFKRILNFFKPSLIKVSTNKGDKYVLNNVAVGSPVFNDSDMSSDAEDDDDMEATDAAGNKVKMSVKNGKITKADMEDGDGDGDGNEDDDEKDDDTDVDNKTVLTNHGIKVTNKIDRKTVINSIAGKLGEVTNKLNVAESTILELREQLRVSNAAVSKREEDLRNEIKSEFTPEGSKRSNKTVTTPQNNIIPQTDLAKNAVKVAMRGVK